MHNQEPQSSIELPQFELIGQDFPQNKQSQFIEEIQDLSLQGQNIFKQKQQRKSRRKRIKQRQTQIIKIKPVQDAQRSNHDELRSKKIEDVTEKQEDIHRQNLTQTRDTTSSMKIDESNDNMQSPVLYRISDEQDIQPKLQDFPQSSRRPLNESLKSDKKSESDDLQSPAKLIKSPRKPRPKQINEKQIHRRFVKMRREVEEIQDRQPTQIYEYNNDDKKSLSSSQQKESSDQQSQKYQQSDDEETNMQNQQQKVQKQQETKIQAKPQVIVFKSNSFHTLINAEIPKGNFVNCIIKRKRGEDFFQKIITYQLYLLEDKKYLMTCVKNRLFRTTSHFEFYKQRPSLSDYHKDNLYACLDSNFTGTQFVLKTYLKCDTNSERSTAIDKSDLIKIQDSMTAMSDKVPKSTAFFNNQTKNVKNQQTQQNLEGKQTCFISFKANFFGFAGQREVKILKKKNKKLRKTGNFSDLKYAQDNGQVDKYFQFQSKKAILGKNGLELDFKGIVKMQSTKNIIIQNQSSKQVLIFGKVKQDIYSVAIGSPLSILEGLAFGIANLDRKFFVN